MGRLSVTGLGVADRDHKGKGRRRREEKDGGEVGRRRKVKEKDESWEEVFIRCDGPGAGAGGKCPPGQTAGAEVTQARLKTASIWGAQLSQ